MRTGIVALLCLGGASAAQLRRASPPAAEASAAEASAASISHVLVLKKPDGVKLELEAMIGVLTSVGVAREQASPILERLEADGEVHPPTTNLHSQQESHISPPTRPPQPPTSIRTHPSPVAQVIVAQGAREPLEQLGQAFGEIGVQVRRWAGVGLARAGCIPATFGRFHTTVFTPPWAGVPPTEHRGAFCVLTGRRWCSRLRIYRRKRWRRCRTTRDRM